MQHWYEDALLVQPKVLTGEQLGRMVPACHEPEVWADVLATYLPRAGVESDHDIALFIAQAGHESASFRELEESLNYSVDALVKLFGRHRISLRDAEMLGRKKGQSADQSALANVLYGGEWGAKNLGNVQPGDGWKYRGGGIFQLTGRYNHTKCAEATGLNLVDEPELIRSDPEAAVVSALWYWNERVTRWDIKGSTKQINGGYNGLADRVERFKRALKVLES